MRKDKHEVAREAIWVPANLFGEALCRNSIKPRQIRIEHDLLSTDQIDPALDHFGWQRDRLFRHF
jgi:hypothetical protein